MFGIYLFVISVALSLIYWFRNARTSCIPNLPPGTMGLPFIGETLEFARKKIEFFRTKHNRYGRVFKTHLFGKPTIRVYGADNLRKILSSEARYTESCYPASVRKLLGSESISMSQGDQHVHKRQQLMKYLCPAFFQDHVPVFSAIIADRIDTWQRKEQVDIHKESRTLFIELALRFIIKLDIGTDDFDAIRKQLDIFTDNIFCLPVNIPGFAFRKALDAKKELRRFFQTYLTENNYFDNNNEGEICSVLEDFRAKYSDKGDLRENELFLDSMIELLFAGAETVSSAGFTLAYELAKSKDCVGKLREELRDNDLMGLNQTVCLNDLKHMDYLDAVVNESLRTTPPIGGFFRTVKEEFQLEGYTVPAGWCLSFGIRDTHLSDDTSTGTEFNPENWLSQPSNTDKYSFIPFGSGLRKCPGQAYAKIILKLFVIELTRNGQEARVVKDSPLVFWPTPRPADKIILSFKSASESRTVSSNEFSPES